jgi:hypothetical protein
MRGQVAGEVSEVVDAWSLAWPEMRWSSVGICLRSVFVIYQDPLAYLLGLEGTALLDAWAGDHDRAFTDARLAEIRMLLDDEKLRDRGVVAERVSTSLVYRQQADGYDAEAGGGLFAMDEPVVAGYLLLRRYAPPHLALSEHTKSIQEHVRHRQVRQDQSEGSPPSPSIDRSSKAARQECWSGLRRDF